MINVNHIKIEVNEGLGYGGVYVENIKVSYAGCTYMIYREDKKGKGKIIHFSDHSSKELKSWVKDNKERLLNKC